MKIAYPVANLSDLFRGQTLQQILGINLALYILQQQSNEHAKNSGKVLNKRDIKQFRSTRPKPRNSCKEIGKIGETKRNKK